MIRLPQPWKIYTCDDHTEQKKVSLCNYSVNLTPKQVISARENSINRKKRQLLEDYYRQIAQNGSKNIRVLFYTLYNKSSVCNVLVSDCTLFIVAVKGGRQIMKVCNCLSDMHLNICVRPLYNSQ